MQAEILRQLRTTTPSEWKEIRSKMDAFHSIGGETGDVIVRDFQDDYLFEGVHAELRRRGLLGANKRIHPSLIPSQYARESAEVRLRLNELTGPISAAERLALGCVVANVVALWMTERRHPIPITRFTLLRNIGKAFEAIDRCFPGYLEAGLIKALLPQLRVAR